MDRNCSFGLSCADTVSSLSVRRAWIEIIDYIIDYATDAVALRKESVDRNDAVQVVIVIMHASLSVRRAWIEISRAANCQHRSHRRSP